MLEYNFIVPGEPIPDARPRVLRSGHTYMPKKQMDQRKLIRKAFKDKFPDAKQIDTVMVINCEFYFGRPKCHYGTGRNAQKIKDRFDIRMHTKKPDFDNLIKLVCDSLNGLAYTDDSIAYSGAGDKYWIMGGEEPATVINIKQVELR